MPIDLAAAHQRLWAWCRDRDFAGHDPFDALNSKLFQSTPLKHSKLARLAATQLFKRSPINLRRFALVAPGKNSKAIALLALAALADYRRQRTKEAETQARQLLDILLSMRLQGWSGAAWGYNFDWQSRMFFAPRGTPMIVPTAFAARALIEASKAFNDDVHLATARSTCDFILRDLRRSVETEMEVCFSYSPHANTRIYNASLLAAEVLASVGSLTGETELCNWAFKATYYVVRRQREDGAWAYGEDASQTWIDNFHTAFVLSSLTRNVRHTPRNEDFQQALRRGYNFWSGSFFLADGSPKYYHDELYPVDAHAAATAIVALADLREAVNDDALALADRIAHWSIENLRDPSGYFYYQRRRFFTIRTPFMRWSQAWMLYALARLLEEKDAHRV
ncbi:MAG TPA: hypothetical protein VJM12_23155 [Pyrinomonadaceae bacterium]|nr:hypothetical protein [Pyrinomonadaceae bacterium]